ncbi:MAG: hypothetical protein ACHQRM_14480, partial [Bacteroidia bacterium]
MRKLLKIILFFFLVFSSVKSATSQTIFASTYGSTYSWNATFSFWQQIWGGQIYKVDLSTCTATVVLPFSAGSPITPQFYDIACDPFNPNILYGIDYKDSVYRIDISVPSYTVINGNFNATHGGVSLHQLNALVSDASGNLYAADGVSPGVYYYNVGANTWTTIGNPGGLLSGGDLTWYNGTLYLTTTTNQLVTVDPSTAAISVVSTLNKTNMYGVVSVTNGANCVSNTQMIGSADSSFYSVNTATGVCTPICTNIIHGGYQIIFGAATLTEAFNPVPVNVSASAVTPSFCAGGSTTLNTGGAVSYVWTPGNIPGSSISVSPGTTTTYTVTGTNAGGCTGTNTVTVTVNPAVSASAGGANATCSLNNGTATATPSGGNGAFTYSWNNGSASQNLSGLAPGTYSVTVTDGNGCQATASTVITQSPAVSVSPAQTPASCGASNGTATANVSGGTGPFTYSWNSAPVQTTSTATALPAGTYSVTVTDSKGCTQSAGITVNSNAGGTAGIASSINPNCNGSATGSATASMTGGTGPFTYSWTPSGGTGITASNLPANTYTCTITDANNCTTSSTVVISQPAVLSVGTSQTAANCGGANGSATASVGGGTGAYTYSWNTTPAQTTVTASGISAGTYSVTVTDAKG